MAFSGNKKLLLSAAACAGVAGFAGWFWMQQDGVTKEASSVPSSCLADWQDADPAYPGMVRVEGGAYRMGDTLYPEEGPLREVTVDAFWIDRTEVTNAQFAEFVQATGYVTVAEREVDAKLHPDLPPEMRKPGAVVFIMPDDVDGTADISQWWHYVPGANWRHPGGPDTSVKGREHYPVTAVTYEDALAYAKWKGRALPTEAQWEWAAREANPDKVLDRKQPKDANTWQGIFPIIDNADDGFAGISPVGCFDPNALGLYDMIGNLWEWTADGYTGVANAQVIKGGSWLCATNYCLRYRPGARQPQEKDLATTHLGFRTIALDR